MSDLRRLDNLAFQLDEYRFVRREPGDVVGGQVTKMGIVQVRTGNRSVNNAPRNTYRTADGKWVAVSTSAQSIAERAMRLVGHPEVIEEPWFASGAERAKHAEELDGYVGGWIARHDLSQVIEAFEEASSRR